MNQTAKIDVLLHPFQRFTRQQAAGGIVLMFATAVAFLWANSPWYESYFSYWQHDVAIGIGEFRTAHTVQQWINDGLMAVFFLAMGMEIKRELLVGELSNPRAAALPILAAAGGVIAPAIIYSLITWGTPEQRGWAIPTATDIAFSIGVMALLGRRVPIGLKIFLTALAIVDDIVAVGVIAFFYTESLSLSAIGGSIAWFGTALALNILGVRRPLPYVIVGLGLWVSVFHSGVHATIAGILLAFTIPARSATDARSFLQEARDLLDRFERNYDPKAKFVHTSEALDALHHLEQKTEHVQAPLLRFQHGLHGWVSFGIMPLFALANAGVRLAGGNAPDPTHPVAIGTMLGLAIGKPLGVTLFSWLSTKSGLATLPDNVSWMQLHGAGWLAGIGFTMALFVAELTFPGGGQLAAAKMAIVTGSIVAGFIGTMILLKTHNAASSA